MEARRKLDHQGGLCDRHHVDRAGQPQVDLSSEIASPGSFFGRGLALSYTGALASATFAATISAAGARSARSGLTCAPTARSLLRWYSARMPQVLTLVGADLAEVAVVTALWSKMQQRHCGAADAWRLREWSNEC